MISQIYKIISTPIKDFLFWQASRIKIGPTQKVIHIVRMDAIGDSVLFSAILPYFRKIYSEHRIVLIVDSVVKELTPWLNEHRVLGEETNSYFDSIIPVDGRAYNRNFFYYYAMLKKIRESCPSIVIHPTFSRNKKSDQLVLISKESLKIGYEGDLSNISIGLKRKNDAKYDRLIKNPALILEPEHNKHLLNELVGFEMLVSGVPVWRIPENLLIETRNELKSIGIDVSKPLVAICPGSSRKVKNWPVSNFISLMLKLKDALPELQFIVIGGAKEKEVGSYIEKNAGIKDVSNLCGKISLPELAKVLSFAKLYIGNNTGSLHISCAVGASAVSIMSGERGKSGEYDSRFFPYPAWKQGAQNGAVFSNTTGAGIEGVTVEDVFDAAISMLKK